MATALESRYLNERDDVARVFMVFRDQQSEITLRFNNIDESYTARVLDVEDKFVLLQNVIPSEGCQHLCNGAPFSISGRVDGLFVYVTDNQARGIAAQESGGYYRVPLPDSVLYQQRRSSARHRLPVNFNAQRSHVRLSEHPPIYARILDISQGGCRVLLEPSRPDVIKIDQEFESCLIHVPNALHVSAQMFVRHKEYDPSTKSMTCGLEITDINPEAQEQLLTFLTKISSSV